MTLPVLSSLRMGDIRSLYRGEKFHDPLPDNHQLSANRLQGLLRRLKQEPAILEEYDRIIQEQLNEGIIEPVQPDETPLGTVHCRTTPLFVETRQSQRCV